MYNQYYKVLKALLLQSFQVMEGPHKADIGKEEKNIMCDKTVAIYKLTSI